MPRVCTVCTHPERKEIDRLLAFGAAAKRRIAAQYGILDTSVCRHAAKCLSPALVEAAKTTTDADAASLVARVRKMVGRLEKLAEDASDYGSGANLLAAARELRPYHELYGKATGELASDRVTALFVNLGVRDEKELRHALDLARTGRDVTLEDFREEVFAGLRFLLAERPEWREDAMKLLQRESYAVEVHDGHAGENGHGNGNGTPGSGPPGEDGRGSGAMWSDP